MQYEYEEDEIDLNKKKVEIIEDEEDKPIINKKVIKYVVIGLLLLLVVVIIGLILIRKEEKEERVLPYTVENSNGYSENVVDIGDREYKIKEVEVGEGVKIEGIVKESGNILDKPSPYGYGLKGVQQGEKIEIIGEVVLEGERTGWIIVRKEGEEGYINEEKVDINIEEEDRNITEEERERLEKTSEELIKEMSKEEEEEISKGSEEIKRKALLEEMERVIEEEEEKNKEEEEVIEEENQGIEIEIERPVYHNQVDGYYYDKEGKVIE